MGTHGLALDARRTGREKGLKNEAMRHGEGQEDLWH